MLTAMPLGYSEPISLFQEAVPASGHPVFTSAQKLSPAPKAMVRTGIASWYSENDAGINLHTANGEIFDDRKMTCASWDYSFGTLLKVTNLANQKSVICRVNDRGPHKRLHRIIDLTVSAFHRIADTRRGLIRVSVEKAA